MPKLGAAPDRKGPNQKGKPAEKPLDELSQEERDAEMAQAIRDAMAMPEEQLAAQAEVAEGIYNEFSMALQDLEGLADEVGEFTYADPGMTIRAKLAQNNIQIVGPLTIEALLGKLDKQRKLLGNQIALIKDKNDPKFTGIKNKCDRLFNLIHDLLVEPLQEKTEPNKDQKMAEEEGEKE
ncbi:MAG: hypothetical protein A2788_01710 [Candidatus Abawacabacteria bacterium RIFCSPHIGHO2_01_FULL_46_8]|uniref:Uncharacterized protein n=1 Tax=Candidatus Abawacabacteria bacterium RIFCSPHIGHO2_01_FULL_46_8 TaxID=1817815 RepID=A0A1F4XLD8_9BACT|nr:MAG: hypothetical protein A2788_01710 [Candidatus Abawacabacteria bacterium RIFCSPHIGHO2_01_FULL_46_8]